mgnify:CR=1 FL=1
MLTEAQVNYLNKLSKEIADRSVQVYPWDKKGMDIADSIIREIKFVVPELEVIFIGSVPLKIAGQKDIDLSVLGLAQSFPEYQRKLGALFGQPDKLSKTAIGWHFLKDDYEVGVYLTDPVTSKIKEQVDIFNLLRNNVELLREYENLKLSSNGLSYREYQIKKYMFFNRVLGIN